MIGAPKLIFQVIPPVVALATVGFCGTTELGNPFFWASFGLGVSTNLVVGMLAAAGRDQALVLLAALTIGFANWTALNWHKPAPNRFEDAEFVGCDLQF